MIDISYQRFGGSIAPMRLSMHSGEAQHIQVAPGASAYEIYRFGIIRAGEAAICRGGLRDFLLQHRMLGLRQSFIVQIKGKPGGQQLVKYDSQRVDIGLDAKGLITFRFGRVPELRSGGSTEFSMRFDR